MGNALTLIVKSTFLAVNLLKTRLTSLKVISRKSYAKIEWALFGLHKSFSLMKESGCISKCLKNNGFAEYSIQINKSKITFVDHVEIMSHHFEDKEVFDPYALSAEAW
jgi:hypothetical protein